jgi:hypothetical protein
VPSVFVSYAHEDQEFVLALIAELEAQGLDARYDQVLLGVGDSLIGDGISGVGCRKRSPASASRAPSAAYRRP